jgi:hypothetical protein
MLIGEVVSSARQAAPSLLARLPSAPEQPDRTE